MCALLRMAVKGLASNSRAGFAVQEISSVEHCSLEEVLGSLKWSTPPQLSMESLISICQRCKKEKNLAYAQCVHLHIRNKAAESQELLGNFVVPMFVECGSLPDAQHVFDNLTSRNNHSWASLLKGYFDVGELQQVLHMYEKMKDDGVIHNRHTLVPPLKACTRLNQIEAGHDVHCTIYKQGLENDLVVGNTLVDMYAKCGLLEEAVEVFEQLPSRDVVSWNALILGYVERGLIDKAFNCIEEMTYKGIAIDDVTLLCCLKACSDVEYLSMGQYTHDNVIKRGLEMQNFLGNALVNMYVKCGSLAEAREVLDRLPTRDVFSWTSMISGYVENGYGKEALECFREMGEEKISPTAATYICSLKACGSTGAIDSGRKIHADIPIQIYKKDPSIGNSLVDMYSKCRSLIEARQVFDELPARDVVSWNTILAGYLEHSHGHDALELFDGMQRKGMTPDTATLNCSLKACGMIKSLDRCQKMHADVVKKGLEKSPLIDNTLVDVYAKVGLLAEAQHVFDRQKIRNVVSWTALISGYAENGLGREALNCLEKMQLQGITPNAVTMACSLKACSIIGAIDEGQEIHAEVSKKGDLYSSYESHNHIDTGEPNTWVLGNALIDMYSKCGNVMDARHVFDAMLAHDLVSWNALITGYSRQGHMEIVFDLFDRMVKERIKPDGITFLCLLSVCCHAGLLGKAQTYFEGMSKDYNVSPTAEHYNCVVDLLGRAGQLGEAVEMLEKMPFQPTIFAWSSILGACRKWRDVQYGRHAFECVLKLDKQHTAALILMFNIYMDAGMWEEAKGIEAMIQALKEPGKSWIEIDGDVHTFLEGNKGCTQYEELHTKLRQVYMEMGINGYDKVPSETSVVHGEGDGGENVPCKHSERLAVAYGLLHTYEGTQLRIVKNMRICEDCHVTLAFISKMEGRSVICKDKTCFHDFKDGRCSCGDCW